MQPFSIITFPFTPLLYFCCSDSEDSCCIENMDMCSGEIPKAFLSSFCLIMLSYHCLVVSLSAVGSVGIVCFLVEFLALNSKWFFFVLTLLVCVVDWSASDLKVELAGACRRCHLATSDTIVSQVDVMLCTDEVVGCDMLVSLA